METVCWSDTRKVRKRIADHGFAGLLSVDLEGRDSINAIGAIRTDVATRFGWRRKSCGLRQALAALEESADEATRLVGRNLIGHDLVLLDRHARGLSLPDLAAIDTLYLSAYPENPYHPLVKRYKEPALASVQVHDPLLVAGLVLDPLADIANTLGSVEEDRLCA